VPVTHVGDGELAAVPLPAGAQRRLAVGTMRATVVAASDQTGGRYSLYRLDLAPAGGGAAPHFHRRFAESFQVLSGLVQLYDGRSWTDAGPGDHLFVPEGGVHGFRNERPEPVSMLSIPAAPREEYFAALARLAETGGTPDDEFYARYDQYMV
jgi:mannose-6-phosphate isomerase-like protein (cupin superfamily)